MSDARNTFLTDTTLTKLVSATNIEELTLGMMMMIHKNRGIAEVRARRFFLSSGENRSVLKDYELENIESGDNLITSPEQESMIRLRTETDYKILSDYINTGEENPVKSIIVKLISSGIMHDILPNLNIKRDQLLMTINNFYDSNLPRINNEFSRFLFKYPKLEKKLPTGRSDLYTIPRTAPIVQLFKEIKTKEGEEPTKEEIKQFEIELGELRGRIKSLYEPSTKDIVSLFGLSPATYTRNIERAQNELGQMLINS